MEKNKSRGEGDVMSGESQRLKLFIQCMPGVDNKDVIFHIMMLCSNGTS